MNRRKLKKAYKRSAFAYNKETDVLKFIGRCYGKYVKVMNVFKLHPEAMIPYIEAEWGKNWKED